MAKRFYAVQHGDDFACDWGSNNKREARKMATELHREYPDEEIRIAYVTDDDDFVEREDIIYSGSNPAKANADDNDFEVYPQ